MKDTIAISRDALTRVLALLVKNEWKMYRARSGNMPPAYVCKSCGAVGEHVESVGAESQRILTPRIHKSGCEMDASIRAIRDSLVHHAE